LLSKSHRLARAIYKQILKKKHAFSGLILAYHRCITDRWASVVGQRSAQIDRAIVGAILSGRPRLGEQALGSVFDASRTIVREALVRLETRGLVHVSPRRAGISSSLRSMTFWPRFRHAVPSKRTSSRLLAGFRRRHRVTAGSHLA
jgi:regulatory GntR family protein